MKKTTACLLAVSLLCASVTNAQLGKLIKKKDGEEKAASSQAPSASNAGSVASAREAEKQVAASKQTWEKNFESGIDWFMLSPMGNLIVASNQALFGVDGTTGDVMWKNDKLGNLQQDNFSTVANSPFVAIVTGGMMNRQHTILDVLDGSVVADTRNMGYKMVQKRYALPNQGGFVLSAFDGGKQTLFFIDANNKKEAWKLQDVFNKNSEMVVSEPFSLNANEFLIATDKNLYKLNSAEGKAVWSIAFKTPMEKLLTEPEEDDGAVESTQNDEPSGMNKLLGAGKGLGGLGGIAGGAGKAANAGTTVQGFNQKAAANKMSTESAGKFFQLDESGNVYYFNNKRFVIIDTKTGQLASKPFEFDDNLATFIPDEKALYFATNEKKSELVALNPKTGQNIWPGAVQLRGRINRMTLNEGKIAVSSAKEKGKNFVNIIDAATGQEVSKREMAVKGQVMSIVMAPRGLIYATTDETNIQDPVTGKDVISKSLKYKTGGASVRHNGMFYVLNDNIINRIDEKTGEVIEFARVNFKDGEDPTGIEKISEGFLVTSNQNMIMLSEEGKQAYHTFYKAPGASGMMKALSIAVMAVSMTQAASHGYQAGMSGFGSSSYNYHQEKADQWGNLGASAMQTFKQRFNMTSSSADHQIILTKIADSDDAGFGLVKVNKHSGMPEAKVVLDDKKPDYLFDARSGMVYFKNARNKLTAFKL